jgi:hypothetical protein
VEELLWLADRDDFAAEQRSSKTGDTLVISGPGYPIYLRDKGERVGVGSAPDRR